MTVTKTTTRYYGYYIHLTAFFQDNLGKPTPERWIVVDFNVARYDGWQWH